MTIAPGATSQSIQVQLVDDSGLALTGKVATDFPTVKYQKSGANAAVTISLVDLTNLTDAYSSGGVKEIAAGFYRLDLPDAALTTATRLVVTSDTTGKHLIAPLIDVQHVKSDVTRWLTGTPNALVTGDVSTYVNVIAVSERDSVAADAAGEVWGAGSRTLTAFGFNVTVAGYASGQDPTTYILSMDWAGFTGFDDTGTIGGRINATYSNSTSVPLVPGLVWEELRASHLTSGTFGEGVNLTSAYDAAKAAASQTSVNNIQTDTTSILARLGAWTGTGVNNVLGALKALFRKDVTAPTDITTGGTATSANDSLQAIRDRGDAAWTTGSGSGGSLSGPSSVTLTFKDASNVVVPLVDFTIAGQGSSRALVDGTSAFGLDDGTYTVTARPTAGLLFPNTTLTVSGTTTLTINGAAPSITPPTLPSQSTGVLTTLDAQGNPVSGVVVYFKMTSGPGTAGSAYEQEFTLTSSGTSTGNLSGAFVIGATYQGWRGTQPKKRYSFTVAAGSSFTLPEILGVGPVTE